MSAPERSLTIGAVLTQLQGDFPDLTISKLRYLDTHGLVSPARTASGYRRYVARDVERLRFVLACQRDRFWPLKVIREALDAYDRGLQPAQVAASQPQAPPPEDDIDLPSREDLADGGPALQLTADELARAAGLDRRTVADLESFGLIRPEIDGHYGRGALRVTRAAATLMDRGLQARHLRPFHLAAQREVGLADQLTAASDESERTDVIRQCLALHLALVRDMSSAG